MQIDKLFSESMAELQQTLEYFKYYSARSTPDDFKKDFELLDSTLRRFQTFFKNTVVNRISVQTSEECNEFYAVLVEAKKLVFKCRRVKWNFIKKSTYLSKLKEVNAKFLNFYEIETKGMQIPEKLLAGKDRNLRLNMEREKYGWRVPPLPSGIVGFEEPLEKLKAQVFAGVGDGWVLDVVAHSYGCGRTTLLKMLCHDPEIREKFGENIFFASATPYYMMMVNDLFNPKFSTRKVLIQSKEDAENKLENFFTEIVSGHTLVVLDDVPFYRFHNPLPSVSRGCKIVMASVFHNPVHHHFIFKDSLSEKDAKTLFCQSAFNECEWKPNPTINNKLVNQMVTCCRKHPLALSVVGRSLNGEDELVWESMLRRFSQCSPVEVLQEHVVAYLERTFESWDDELKECFLDFGLFPKNHRIPVSTLLNMWVHLYNHDDEGLDTLATISELSYKNLVNLMTTGNDLGATVRFCDQQFVTQHDLLWGLAYRLNNKQDVADRRRLFVHTETAELPSYIKRVYYPFKACILSISTGEFFTSQWCDMEVPDVEVLLLHFESETYTLPQFLDGMQKLKIVDITNCGLYPTKLENFHLLSCSYNLTRIRLERVAISTSILSLVNLQKVSFIMCKIGNAFKKLGPNTLPQLLELEIDYCQDLVEFPEILCTSLNLKKLSITNCSQMSGLPEEFTNLTILETLSLRSCPKLKKLPESISRLQKLSILDISGCSSLSKLPDHIGKLGGLRVIYMKGCSRLPNQLPPSVNDLSHTYVVCDEEISYQWREFRNVEIHVAEED